MLYTFIKNTISSILWSRDKKLKEQKKMLKDRLLRYFEKGQTHVHSSFVQTKDDILMSNLFNPNELDIAFEALEELVANEFIEYEGGYYYLKGYVPKL